MSLTENNGSFPLRFAYYSHHKCATKFFLLVLARLCRDAGWNFRHVDRVDHAQPSIKEFVAANNLSALAVVNAEYEKVAGLGVPAFHVIRDPRDMIVSGYFSHLKSHSERDWPELTEHRKRLQSLSKEDGLLAELDFSRQFLDDLATWSYSDPNILELRFEQVASDPYGTVLLALEWVGVIDPDDSGSLARDTARLARSFINRLSYRTALFRLIRKPQKYLSGEDVLRFAYRNRFSKQARGRTRGETDESSHYRRGIPGDWMNHFTPPIAEKFNTLYGTVLEKTGYTASTQPSFAVNSR